MKKIICIVITVLVFWHLFVKETETRFGPGVMAPDIPLQSRINSSDVFSFQGYKISPLAEFNIKAKVLSKKRYRFDREADLSSIDLALGWGRMSDEQVLEEFTISQSGRWYRWQTKSLPIPRKEIETSSANMHLIAKDQTVEDTLNLIRMGDVVTLSGKLVKAVAPDGWRWNSSLTRNDTGAGACELLFVEKVMIENR